MKENTGLSACLLGCVYLSAAEGAEPPALQPPCVLLQHRQQVAPSEVQLVRRLCFVVVHGSGDAVLKGRKVCLSSLLCVSFVLYLLTSPSCLLPCNLLPLCLPRSPISLDFLLVHFLYLSLSINLYLFLFIYLSVYQYASVSINLSLIYQSIFLSRYLSFNPSIT